MGTYRLMGVGCDGIGALSNVITICLVGGGYQSDHGPILAPLVDVSGGTAQVVVKVEPNVEVSCAHQFV